MKRMRIGIPLIGGQSWHGGITYIESILKAFHALPSQERPSLHFFITYDQLNQLKLFEKLFYLMDEKIVIGGEIDQEELQKLDLKKINSFSEILEHVDFIYPVNSSSLAGTPHAVWIPDLQHKELKELFSDDDYLLREQKITLALAGQEKIIVSSKSTYDNFKKYFPEYLDRLEVVHFYSNFELKILKESPLSVVEKYKLSKNFLICCNQFWQHKNHDTLLRALALTNESVHLVCTGAQLDYRNQEWFSKLDTIVKDNNLVSRVTFLGFIPREDQVQLMRQSIAVVQPSKFEGWSTVMEDARALSKPVLASNIDVHLEQNLSKAKYFDKSSPEQLAALMDEVVRQEIPGPNKAEEQAAKEILGLQELVARKLLEIAWSTSQRFNDVRQNSLLNNELIQQLNKTSEKMGLNADLEFLENLSRVNGKITTGINSRLLDIKDVNRLRELEEISDLKEVEIYEASLKVKSQAIIFLQLEHNIETLDFTRQFLDVVLSIKKPKTYLVQFTRFPWSLFFYLILRKIKYISSKLWRPIKNIYQGKLKNFILNVKNKNNIIHKFFYKTKRDIDLDTPKLEEGDELSQLRTEISKKVAHLLYLNRFTPNIEQIRAKEVELKYNKTTLENLLLGSLEKEKIITNLKIHIQWQFSELNNLFLSGTFFSRCYQYFLIRIKNRLPHLSIYRISLRQSWPIAKLKFLFKALSLRYRDLKHDLNPSSTPIGLGLLHQHPPKKIHISRLEKAKNSGAYKISLVSPSLGQGMYIERTILSVLAQAYSKLEYIIQDGGSSDLTKEIVSSYTSIVTGFESAKDQGQSHAINIAFKKSTGDIMGWLNSDDMLAPGALDLVAHCFEKNPNIDVVYGNRIIIDSEDRIIGKWILPEHDNDVLLWADFIPQETMFWRRELWEKCGARIDEDFQFAMDWELILRFREAGARFKRIPAFLGYFRVHEEQKTTRDLKTRGAQEMNLLRKKYLGKIPSDEEVYLAIRPYLERHRVENFKYLWKEKFGMT